MQHLEVSGAVRPIYKSLGVKGLTDYKIRARRGSVCSVLLYNEHNSTLSTTRCQKCMEPFVYNRYDVSDEAKDSRITKCGIYVGERVGVYRVLVGEPEGKKPLGKPRRRWEGNIKMNL